MTPGPPTFFGLSSGCCCTPSRQAAAQYSTAVHHRAKRLRHFRPIRADFGGRERRADLVQLWLVVRRGICDADNLNQQSPWYKLSAIANGRSASITKGRFAISAK
jgi:hypothetical protein